MKKENLYNKIFEEELNKIKEIFNKKYSARKDKDLLWMNIEKEVLKCVHDITEKRIYNEQNKTKLTRK